mmetsp:Transcript_25537/g.72294  ORF Transcript_25537/g.72294 Transcript_25537/m.72294 type:complete len:297 (+) Transcript_25537:373-1263(+)
MAVKMTKTAIQRETMSICTSTLVFFFSTLETRLLIWPISVSSPLRMTMPRPWPCEMRVAEKQRFLRSPRGTLAGFSASMTVVIFSTGSDSPVRAASCEARLETLKRRRSAGMRSPVASSTMSPTTSSRAGTVERVLSRRTVASDESMALSASADFSALPSWRMPIQVLRMMTPRMRPTSIQEVMASSPVLVAPLMAETTATTKRMKTRTLLIWSQMRSQMVRFFFSVSSLGPSRSKRILASWVVRPLVMSTENICATASTDMVWKAASGAALRPCSMSAMVHERRTGAANGSGKGV